MTGLSRDQLDAVIRRAAELAGSDPDPQEVSLTDAEVLRIGREVGLEERHVRAALREVRSGPPVEEKGLIGRMFGPSTVRGVRPVPGDPDLLAARLDGYFTEAQLLERVRKAPRSMQYRKAEDFASAVARAFNFRSRKSPLSSARSVEVALAEEPIPGEPSEAGRASTVVEIRVDPGERTNHIVGAVALGGGLGLGTAGGTAAFFAFALGLPVVLAIGGGAVIGTGVLAGIASLWGSEHRKLIAAHRAEVEGLLDRLELEESLDDPPSWRRWMRRQLGGIADDMGARRRLAR